METEAGLAWAAACRARGTHWWSSCASSTWRAGSGTRPGAGKKGNRQGTVRERARPRGRGLESEKLGQIHPLNSGRTGAIGPTRPHIQPETLVLQQRESSGALFTHQGPTPFLSDRALRRLHGVQTYPHAQCSHRPCMLAHSVHGLDAQVCRQTCVKAGSTGVQMKINMCTHVA